MPNQMNSYTSKTESDILFNILGNYNADMCYQYQKDRLVGEPDYKDYPQFEVAIDKRDIPCWSLGNLLTILPSSSLDTSNDHYFRIHCNGKFSEWHETPIAACIEMIKKLDENNMLNI